jgi:hypothetical protein
MRQPYILIFIIEPTRPAGILVGIDQTSGRRGMREEGWGKGRGHLVDHVEYIQYYTFWSEKE